MAQVRAVPAPDATAVMPAATAGGWGSVMGGASMPPMAPSPASGTLVADEYLVEDDPGHRRLMIQIAIGAAAVIGLIILVVTLFSLANKNQGNTTPAATTGDRSDRRQSPAGRCRDPAHQARPRRRHSRRSPPTPSPKAVSRAPIRRPDEQVPEKSPITVWISTGADMVAVPDVKGLTQDAAIKAIEAAGLKVVRCADRAQRRHREGSRHQDRPRRGGERRTRLLRDALRVGWHGRVARTAHQDEHRGASDPH